MDKSENVKQWIYGILILSLLIRLLVVFITIHYHQDSIILMPDSSSYTNSAEALLRTGHFTVSPDNPEPQVARTPGYPVFLALVIWLFGKDYHFSLTIIQVLINFITIAVATYIANELWDLKTAMFVTSLLFFDILSLIYSQNLLSETLFTFFLIVSILPIVKGVKNNNWGYINSLLSGTLIALTTLIRPITLHMIILLIPIYFYVIKTIVSSWRKSLLYTIIYLIPWIVLIQGWQVRNYMVAGTSDFATVKYKKLWVSGAGILAKIKHIPLDEAMLEIIDNRKGYKSINLNDAKWYASKGIRLVREHPIIFFQTSFEGMVATIIGPGIGTIKVWIPKKEIWGALGIFSILFIIISYTGGLTWVWHIRHETGMMQAHIVILTVISYFIMLSAWPDCYSRYRVPIIPLLSLYGGRGLFILFRIVHEKYLNQEKDICKFM
jgi:Dolichyl-phosphate-mannose-protein mannosyltransferase